MPVHLARHLLQEQDSCQDDFLSTGTALAEEKHNYSLVRVISYANRKFCGRGPMRGVGAVVPRRARGASPLPHARDGDGQARSAWGRGDLRAPVPCGSGSATRTGASGTTVESELQVDSRLTHS